MTKPKKSAMQATLLGAFVLGAVALATLLLMSIGGKSWGRHFLRYRIFFHSSVKGLNVGAPVMFRGISVGEVESVNLASPANLTPPSGELPSRQDVLPVVATVKLFPEKLGFPPPAGFLPLPSSKGQLDQANEFLGKMVKEHHLRARLETLSLLTGQIYISLYIPSQAPRDPDGLAEKLWHEGVIPSRLSALDSISQKINGQELENSLESFQKFLQQLAAFVEQGRAQKTLDNLESTLRNLSRMSDTLAQALPNTLQTLEETGQEARQALRKSRESLARLQGEIAQTLQGARNTLEETQALLQEGRPRAFASLQKMDDTLAQAQSTLQRVDLLLAELQETGPGTPLPPPTRLGETLQEAQMTMKELRTLLETLNRFPQALLLGTP